MTITILGWKLNETKITQDNVEKKMKTDIAIATQNLHEHLNKFDQSRTLDLEALDYAKIFQEIRIIKSYAMVMTQTGLFEGNESTQLLNLEHVTMNLEYLLYGATNYQKTNTPFTYGVCERINFESEQDIIEEIESFSEVFDYSDQTDHEKRWSDFIIKWNGEGKRLCENWESPLLN